MGGSMHFSKEHLMAVTEVDKFGGLALPINILKLVV
jgi:hypothetical protein